MSRLRSGVQVTEGVKLIAAGLAGDRDVVGYAERPAGGSAHVVDGDARVGGDERELARRRVRPDQPRRGRWSTGG